MKAGNRTVQTAISRRLPLFVLDVFFVIAGWPATSPDESFAESYIEPTK
jgi:hypothetical protein